MTLFPNPFYQNNCASWKSSQTLDYQVSIYTPELFLYWLLDMNIQYSKVIFLEIILSCSLSKRELYGIRVVFTFCKTTLSSQIYHQSRVISLVNTLRWSITTTAFVCKIHIKVKVWSCKEKEWKRRRKCRDKKVSFSFLFDRSEPYIFVEFVISH